MTELNAVLVRLMLTAWSRRVTDKQKTAEVIEAEHASADAGNWRKNLLPKSAVGKDNLVDEIAGVAGQARALQKRLCLPWESPWWLLPVKNEPALRQGLQGLRAEFNELVARLPQVWESYVSDAQKAQAGMAKAEDYPLVAALMSEYSFAFDFSPVPKIGRAHV